MSELRIGSMLGWSLLGLVVLAMIGLSVAPLVLPAETLSRIREQTGLQWGTPEWHVLPQGYEGWVIVRYGVAGAPALETEGERLVFRYPESGLIETATEWRSGVKHRTYSRGGEGASPELPWVGPDALIHGNLSIRVREYIDDADVFSERRDAFFVGTREEFEAAGSLMQSPLYLDLPYPGQEAGSPADAPPVTLPGSDS